MKRVLIAHPCLAPAGGANAVAAWALQALREEFAVALATLGPVDLAAVNRSFGTDLGAADFTTFLAPRRYRRLIGAVRAPGALLECQLTVRLARRLDREHRFDVLLSTHNEVDFGRRGIQYVNLPGTYLPGRESRRRWSHRVPGLHAAFRAACYALGRTRRDGPLRNLFLADSENIARRIREVYGVDSVVLYPPVAGPFPRVPWQARRHAVVAVGRITPSKRWEMAVAIVDALRGQGHDLALTLIGHREDPRYEARLRGLAAARPWLRLLPDLGRRELLAELGSHRYGLHTTRDEHFGIAPAEILAAGCVPFVHASGGPVEIVGAHPDLVFDTVADAVERIGRVLADAELELALRRHAARRRRRFTAARFCAELRAIVRGFE
ncbi:MAG TPA: glycosyltransferase [Thermoanaerobaculia bacterium]|jgi:glycosyltransferase involved in cell wall biosynthesis|nr:glycosyltransferase [Thermoanaerobaculia bacterium]